MVIWCEKISSLIHFVHLEKKIKILTCYCFTTIMAAERVTKMLMQHEQLIFKNLLKYKTDQLKSKSTDFYAISTDIVAKQTTTFAKPKVIHWIDARWCTNFSTSSIDVNFHRNLDEFDHNSFCPNVFKSAVFSNVYKICLDKYTAFKDFLIELSIYSEIVQLNASLLLRTIFDKTYEDMWLMIYTLACNPDNKNVSEFKIRTVFFMELKQNTTLVLRE